MQYVLYPYRHRLNKHFTYKQRHPKVLVTFQLQNFQQSVQPTKTHVLKVPMQPGHRVIFLPMQKNVGKQLNYPTTKLMDHYEFHPLLAAILGLKICIYQLRNQLRLQRLRQSDWYVSSIKQNLNYSFRQTHINIILSLINWAVITGGPTILF